MAVAPGVYVTTRATVPARGAPTDTGQWFVAGETYRGTTSEAVEVRSIADFEDVYGERQTFSWLWDALDVYFREGGAVAYVARVVGPTPTKATATDATIGLVYTAADAGAWGANLSADVDTGTSSGFKVTVRDQDGGISGTAGTVLQTEDNLADKTAITAAFASSEWMQIVSTGSGTLAAAAETALTGGTDDRSNITETEWQDALALFDKALGPGQVSTPGRTSTTAHASVMSHAADNNRFALLDAPDTGTTATITTAAATDRAATGNDVAQLLAPWVTSPGSSGERTVPPSCVQAAMIARSDASNGTANVAVAGENGETAYANLGVSQTYSDTDRATLNEAGVTVIRQRFGAVRTYGRRTLTVTTGAYLDAGNSRFRMQLIAESEALLEPFMFDQLDGRGTTAGLANDALAGNLLAHYNRSALYGANAADAFRVDTGPTVNTPSSIAEGVLKAVISVRMSPNAERVELEIVKVPVTEAV